MPAAPAPDPTGGWKDTVWGNYGHDSAECMGLEDAGLGCVRRHDHAPVEPPVE